MSAFGSNYAAASSPPPPSSAYAGGDAQSMMLQMGLRYGQSVLQDGEKGLMRHMPLISSVHRYFRVDNQYVKRKLGILLFPFTRNFQRVEESAESDMSDQTPFGMNAVSPTSAEKAPAYPSRTAPLPLHDVMACDLYLPLMGTVTYVILSAFLHGMHHNTLTNEHLLTSASSLVFWFAVEVLGLKVLSYVLRVRPEMVFLDLMALCGYKYILICLIVLLREVAQLESDAGYLGCMASYVVAANGFFVWKSIARMYQRDGRTPSHARLLAFVATCLQVPFVFWLAIKPFR